METCKSYLPLWFVAVIFCQVLANTVFSQHRLDPILDPSEIKSMVLYGHPYHFKKSVGLLTNTTIPVIPGGISTGNGVDLYSGTNRVAIPLYSVSARGLTLPLSIGYASSGIKVSQISGPIGLGWSLNAGGCIRRMVRGLPDDFCESPNGNKMGWITDNLQGCTIATTWTPVSEEVMTYSPFETSRGNLKHLLAGDNANLKHDLEPDMFVIDCPYISGSFIFSSERDTNQKPTIRSIGQSNMKFSYSVESTQGRDILTGFTITDESGNKYFFEGNVEKYITHEYTAYNNNSLGFFLNGNFAYETSIDRIFNNAWFLQRIETYLGESVLFSYEIESFVADPNYVTFNRGEGTTPSPSTPPWKRYESQFYPNPDIADYIETYRIKEIVGSDFSIDFIAKNDRQDLNNHFTNGVPEHPCKQIDKIVIKNRFGPTSAETEFVRQFDFTYDYMSGDCITVNTIPHGCDFPGANKRLLLTKLTESSNFEAFLPYEFSYEPGALPNRFSFATDIYGFYNGETSNQTNVPAIYIYPGEEKKNDRFWLTESCTGQEIILPGANRNFVSDYAKIGLLDKIKYPSGAEVTYTYEPHIFTYKSIPGLEGAGFRLSSKTTSGNSDILLKEEYLYQNGKALGYPSYGYYDPTHIPENTFSFFNANYVRTGANISNSDGSIGYDTVTVTKNNSGGSTEYYFENTPTLDDPVSTVPSLSYYSPPGIQNTVALIPQNGDLSQYSFFDLDDEQNTSNPFILQTYPYPYRDLVNVDWLRGRVKKVVEKDNNHQDVMITEYTYQERYKGSSEFGDLPDQEIIYGIRTGFLINVVPPVPDQAPVAVATKYAIYTGVASLLKSTKTTSHTNNGESIQQVDYTYNEAGQPATVKTTNSDGTVFQKHSKWVYDYFNPRRHPDTYYHYVSPSDVTTYSLYMMAYQNVPNILVEEINEVSHGSDIFVKGGTLNTYKWAVFGPPIFALDKQYILPTATLLSTDPNVNGHFSNSGITSPPDPIFQYDYRYKAFQNNDKYDCDGRLIESHQEDNCKMVSIWDQYLDLNIANIINSDQNECAYDGFEFARMSTNSSSQSSQCVKSSTNDPTFAGDYMLEISPSGSYTLLIDLSQNKPMNNGYTGSVWVKGGTEISLYLQAKNNSSVLVTKNISNPSSPNEWHLLSLSLSRQELESLNYNSIVVTIGNTTNSDVFIDEVKCFPLDAIFTSNSYDSRNNLIASSSKNDVYSYSEYDDLGRSKLLRDFEGNILLANYFNSSNPSNFSVCDCVGNGVINDGIFLVNEPLTITCNSKGIPLALFKFSYNGVDFSENTTGVFTHTFTPQDIYPYTIKGFTLTMKVVIGGAEYQFSREVNISQN